MHGRIRGRPIITVSDAPTFAANGGMIQMDLQRGTAYFRINVRAILQSQVKLSASLLRMSQIVER
jgi:hypothetical protein